jgi:hypothetical protein
MSEKNYRITGDVSGIVGDGSTQTITNSFNHCANPAAAESELAALKNLLAGLMANLPEDKKEEVEVYAEDLEKSATSTDLKAKKKFSLSARSLLEAAKWVKDFTGNIGGTLLNLGKAIWPGFQLPETSKSRPGMIPDK